MMHLANYCTGPGSVCCSLLMATCESAQTWTLVQGSSPSYPLELLVSLPFSAISKASPITYSSAPKTFLLVLRYVFRIFHSGSCDATLAPVHYESSFEPSIQKDICPARPAYLLTSSAPSSLLHTMGAFASWKRLLVFPLGVFCV